MSMNSWLNELKWKTKTALLNNHMPMTAWHRHGVGKSGDMLPLWDGIPLNLQKMGQVSQVAVGVDVGICRSLQLVPQGCD